uniref:Glycolipid transfer protein domain-containing protein n=1 Tax=Oncorhynchus tshawytscha TaxID=74940 RepID=A0A8C8GDX8_ONCTS
AKNRFLHIFGSLEVFKPNVLSITVSRPKMAQNGSHPGTNVAEEVRQMFYFWSLRVRFIQVLLQTCALALKKYHGWLVQKLFKAAVFAAPYKADFLRALSKRSRKRTAGTKYDFLVNFTATDAIYEKYTKMNAEI